MSHSFSLSTIQVPPFLQPGDRLGVMAPSGALREVDRLAQGLAVWRSRGYELVISPQVDRQWHYLAGRDEDRRSALADLWGDPAIKAILCVRGGYGGMRLLEDWVWLPGSPKWLVGFSDITSLLWSLAQQGIAGVHGPVLTTLSQEPAWSCDRLFDLLEGRPVSSLTGTPWGGGRVAGPLLPANLTLATHLLGTPFQPDFRGAILAFEDVGEAPYRLDRQLTQWRLSGLLAGVAGIALGRFSQCEGTGDMGEMLRDRLGDLGLPIVSDLPFGHDGPNAALRMGQRVILDGDRGSLDFA